MKEWSILVKPASSLCNMRCRYCFYADVAANREVASYGVMKHETARRMLTNVRADMSGGDQLSILFQGGEPTLAGKEFFRDFFAMTDDLFHGIKIQTAFQTNGLLLDEEWCQLFRERNMLVGLSMDGNAQTHDACRPDAFGKGTSSRVRRAMGLLKKHGIPFNILTVLTESMAGHPQAVWNWLIREDIRYVQFIPCLGTLEQASALPEQPDGEKARNGKETGYALTPKRFQDFYAEIFRLWKRSLEEGRYISVKLFDDLANLYLAGKATACGITGNCSVQYVVEANGDVFPCDFYVLDSTRMGSILEKKPSELYDAGRPFLTEGRGYAQEEPCASCRYHSSCRGGCKRMKDGVYLENGICWYARLLDEILEPLCETVRTHFVRGGAL